MMKDLPGPLPLTADEMPIEEPEETTDPEIEHLKFVDADGATFVIESENGCVTIQVSGGHTEYGDDIPCEGCDDCIETVALYAADIPTIIEGLQLALQHAALTGEYGKAGTIEGEVIIADRCTPDGHVIPHRGCILR
ncbi:hypothetical protein FDI41_gp45 [Arthrobacter phage Piccoletto]|uniref:Uncharacterized protein n=1 Tax=Arthrobacter phage Piccoletto TaxID=2024282 RepID=A0A222Z9X6_9CAUD|nr:hypothetical protein FDI41_gp45 [Arthrobacter phage Piccoletto]ASR80676.1 hypothetical protein SEA_PICCOLETTO_45 [Arthrobacter phage Piccoletto]